MDFVSQVSSASKRAFGIGASVEQDTGCLVASVREAEIEGILSLGALLSRIRAGLEDEADEVVLTRQQGGPEVVADRRAGGQESANRRRGAVLHGGVEYPSIRPGKRRLRVGAGAQQEIQKRVIAQLVGLRQQRLPVTTGPGHD